MPGEVGEFESSCTCAICFDELGTHIAACPCGHVYHHSCILTWVNQKRLCPQCKADALPLIPLTFNIFQLSKEEKALSNVERMSALKSELKVVLLGIDNEIAEINVLEPQLAECRVEEQAYRDGVLPKEIKKNELEAELVRVRMSLSDLEAKNKALNEELAAMRGKICRYSTEVAADSSTRNRRVIQSSEIPKIMSFLSADGRRLREMEKEREQLEAQMILHKQRIAGFNRKIKALVTSSGVDPSLVRASAKKVNFRVEGFVPIDSLGHKRRREDEMERERENQKPTLFEKAKNVPESQTLDKLAFLVSLLSEDEEESVAPAPSDFGHIIVLD